MKERMVKVKSLLNRIRPLFKGVVILFIFIAQSEYAYTIKDTVIGQSEEWYKLQVCLELTLLVISFFLAELVWELSTLLIAGIVINEIAIHDFNNGTNFVYDNYPWLMTNLYYACLFAFGIYFIRKIYEINKSQGT